MNQDDDPTHVRSVRYLLAFSWALAAFGIALILWGIVIQIGSMAR